MTIMFNLLLIAAIPAIFSLVAKTAASYAIWEALDMGYKKLMGKGDNNNVDGTIWKLGPVSFSPLAVYTIKDPVSPAYAILTMSTDLINGKRLFRCYMVGTGESIVLTSYTPDLHGTFLKLGGPWTKMPFKNGDEIKDFTSAKGFNLLISWI